MNDYRVVRSGLEYERVGDRAYVCRAEVAEEVSEDEGQALPPPGLFLGAEEVDEGEESDVWSKSSGDLSGRDSPVHDDTNSE